MKDLPERLSDKGGFSPEAKAWMERRAEQFLKATSGKGKPMVYGSGKPPSEK